MEARPYPDSSALLAHRSGGGHRVPGYGWYLTVSTTGHLGELVRAYQQALAGFSFLDVVPGDHLHVTLQGVGPAPDFKVEELDDLLAGVQQELASIAAPVVTFAQAVVEEEGVAIAPEDPGPIVAVRALVRRATRQLWGGRRGLDEPAGFRPHLSIAYANGPASVRPVRAALDRVQVRPAAVVLEHVTLLERFPDGSWQELGIAPLMVDGPPGSAAH